MVVIGLIYGWWFYLVCFGFASASIVGWLNWCLVLFRFDWCC